ncbi:MAG TPA: FAD:protein FMN transferase [Planctomycetaceae bacterium]|nr:FAD:protein FMN transferase [Planctomycetaceae bacterium]
MMTCSSLLLAALAIGQTTDRLPERFEFTQIQMGMPFRIVLYAPAADSANASARAAYARIRELNGIMSDYEPDSELTRLCRTAGSGQAVPVSPDLLAVLSRAQALSEKSHGAFDVTVGPVVRLWRKARKTNKFPAEEELAAARELVGYRNLRIDEKAGTVELLKRGMQIDLGGIAVGYAIDDVLRLLKARGIKSALIDGSGDIGVSDSPPGTTGWRIGIAPVDADREPSRYVILKNAAVTTSGDAFQFVEFAGKRYSHIVDPKTGLGLVDRVSVTLLAPNCTVADSYTKAVAVLGPEKGLALIDETPGAAAIVVRAPQGKAETLASKRLGEFTFESASPSDE